MKALINVTALFFLLSSCGFSDEETGWIWGTVTSVNGGSPIAGVLVQCEGLTYTTGSDGVYSIQNIPVGSRTLVASKTDFDLYSRTVIVEANSGTQQDIEMVSNIQGASVWGYVYDSEGKGIPNVEIEVSGMKDNTDATGRYQLPSIPQGQYTITAEADGYESFSQAFYLYSSDKQIDIILRKFHIIEQTPTKDTHGNADGTGDQLTAVNYQATGGLTFFAPMFFYAPFEIPESADVTGFEILLYLNGTGYSNSWSKNWYARAIIENWSGDNTDGRPETTLSYFLRDSDISNEGGFRIFDLTLLIEEEFENVINYGFTLHPINVDDKQNYHYFASSEDPDKDKRPIIRLSYTY